MTAPPDRFPADITYSLKGTAFMQLASVTESWNWNLIGSASRDHTGFERSGGWLLWRRLTSGDTEPVWVWLEPEALVLTAPARSLHVHPVLTTPDDSHELLRIQFDDLRVVPVDLPERVSVFRFSSMASCEDAVEVEGDTEDMGLILRAISDSIASCLARIISGRRP